MLWRKVQQERGTATLVGGLRGRVTADLDGGGEAPRCLGKSMSDKQQQVQRPEVGAFSGCLGPRVWLVPPSQTQPPGPPCPFNILLYTLMGCSWFSLSPRTASHIFLPISLRDLGIPFPPDSPSLLELEASGWYSAPLFWFLKLCGEPGDRIEGRFPSQG